MDQLTQDTPAGARVRYTTKVRQADGTRRNVTRWGTYTGETSTRGSTHGGGRTRYYQLRLDDGTTTQVAKGHVLEVPPAPMPEDERDAAAETVLTVPVESGPDMVGAAQAVLRAQGRRPLPEDATEAQARSVLEATPPGEYRPVHTGPVPLAVPPGLADAKRPAEAKLAAERALRDLPSGWEALERLDLLLPEPLDPELLGQLHGVLEALYPRLHGLLAQ